MKGILLSLVFFGFFAINSQDERGPHNGFMQSVGEYKIEALGCNEYLEIYIFDKYMNAILNYGITGDVKFMKQDGSGTSDKLVYYGTDGFTAKFPDYDIADFKVVVNIKGNTYTAKFRNECIVVR